LTTFIAGLTATGDAYKPPLGAFSVNLSAKHPYEVFKEPKSSDTGEL